MYEEHHKHKKIFMGIALLLFGILWYMKDTGVIILEPFWPIVFIMFGALMIVKGLVMSACCKEKPKRRR